MTLPNPDIQLAAKRKDCWESLHADCQEGHFPLFCDDVRPTNMLVDPATLRITAILNWESTNTMPPQFAKDIPWWLLLRDPAQ